MHRAVSSNGIIRHPRLLLALSLMAGLLRLQTVRAQPPNEPMETFPVTDGVVYSIGKNSNTLYLGGIFSLVGVRTGSGVPVSITTGQPEAVYPSVNGDVNAVIPDGQGGWYIGGTFSLVGGVLRTNLAHIRSDRTVDPDWSPVAAGGGVNTLVLSGSELYFGGSFTNVNGQTRNGLAAVDTVSGAANGWNPNVIGSVQTMVLDNTNVYVGGQFSTLGGQPRNSIGSVDAASGLVTAWNPGTTSATGSPPEVYSLVASGGHLYVGGYFVTAGGQSRSCAASFALSTGLLDSWNPNIGGVGIVSPSVFAMAAYSNTLFAVGVIGNAGASNRLNIVQLDGTTGLATSWDAKEVLVTSSGILMNNISSVAVYSNTVYVGGFLINIGGQPRGFAAALDVNTGLATAWNPQPNFIPRACCGSGSALYLGGLFGALSCMQRTNLAAYDLGTHQITPFSATFSGLTNASPSVNALLVVSNQLVVGGYFTNVNGVTVSNLMAFDLATGSVKTWKPSPNGIVDSLTTWSNRLFAGGLFANINGIVRTNFAEFLLDNGSMTSWDPGFSHGQILTFAVDGNTLYAGGIITSVGGVARSRLAAFDLPTDTLTSFDPGISGPQVRSVTVQNGRVYVGGRFNSVAGLPYTNYFSINADMSNLFPPHNVDGTVYGVAVVSNSAASSTVFLGGFFGNVDGQSRTNLAALDTFSDALTPWNPTMDSGYIVENLCAIDGTLYVCGQFFHAGGETMRGIAAFPLGLVGTPAIVSNSTRQLGDGSLQFRLNALGVPQATVLASSNLTGWTPLQIVPLVDGNGIFADSSATNYPRRFYRLSVP